MKAVRFSETLVTYRTTRRHSPNFTPPTPHPWNLKSRYILTLSWYICKCSRNAKKNTLLFWWECDLQRASTITNLNCAIQFVLKRIFYCKIPLTDFVWPSYVLLSSNFIPGNKTTRLLCPFVCASPAVSLISKSNAAGIGLMQEWY